MARPKLQIHPVGIAIIVFGFLGWVVALGGVGAASYQCQTSQSYEICAKEYQWEWWTVWLQFSLLLALFIAAFQERAFKRGQAVFLAFFSIATICVMLSAHNFITHVAIGPMNVRDYGQDAINAGAAGFVLLGITNFALLIVIGRDLGAPPEAVAGTGAYQAPGSAHLQFQTSAPV